MTALPEIGQARKPDAWGPYLPVVEQACPGAGPNELELRARLMLLRDLANQQQKTCTWEAAQAFMAIEHVCGGHATTPMPIEMLTETRTAMLKFWRAAHSLDALFSPACAG